jgi:transposase-like protein
MNMTNPTYLCRLLPMNGGIIILTLHLPTQGAGMAKAARRDAKARALAEQGVLNPAPERVTDERFRSGTFFDPRDLVQVKYEMVRRVRTEGVSVTASARAVGVSRPTYYQAQRALDQAGLPALVPKRPGPKGAHKLTDAVMGFVDRVRGEGPGVGAPALSQRVRARFGLTVHPRSIERALARREKKRRRAR